MELAKRVGSGELVRLLIGDELVVPGIPQHKMIYVGPIGRFAKGQAAQFVRFDFLPNRDQLLVGERGTTHPARIFDIQARARDIVRRGVVNAGIRLNCEHICSYIRDGKEKRPRGRRLIERACGLKSEDNEIGDHRDSCGRRLFGAAHFFVSHPGRLCSVRPLLVCAAIRAVVRPMVLIIESGGASTFIASGVPCIQPRRNLGSSILA